MTNKIKKKTEKGEHRFHVIMNESMQQPMVNLQGLKSMILKLKKLVHRAEFSAN
jgi:hypothetical protein